MPDASQTRPSLLLAIRDQRDGESWGRFVELYTPLIYRYCVRRGLQEADAADVAQEVMKAVAQAIPKFEYARARGSFRSWILTVTRSKLNNFFASRARRPPERGDTETFSLVDAQAQEVFDWDLEYQRRLFESAAKRVRPEFQEKTWQAFWRTVVDEEEVSSVADNLRQSVGAIYIARSRVLARLRTEIRAMRSQQAGSDEGG